MEEKITIIEGPPPTFEEVEESWAHGLIESPIVADVAITRLRTFNGPALLERCNRAWRKGQTINLEYRSPDGLEQKAPIVAARYVQTDEGDLLILWVRLENKEVELELDYKDNDDDFDDYDDDDDDYEEDDDVDDPLGPSSWSF